MEIKKSNASDIFTIPNILSFIRLCMIPLIVWLYCGKEYTIWAGILLLVSGATDVIDGYLARHFGWVSDLGKVLDPVADKLTQGAMLICLILRYPLILLPFGLMAGKELFMIVSGLMRIKKTGAVFSARWHGKLATLLLYTMMLLHVFWADIPPLYSDISIYAASATVLLSFIFYGRDNLRILLKDRKACE